MASTDLKEIIGDVRFALATQLRQQYPGLDGTRGFLHTTEATLVKAQVGLDLKERGADYYIAPGDGGGLIVVEVGDRDDQKWESLASQDGQPVRVLTVGLDRAVTLDHPRHTQFEGDLLSVLREVKP
jgi:hypothetical protein